MKKMNIHELRKAGYKVRVLHGRLSGRDGRISPRGGFTAIELTTPDGKTSVAATAECSLKETFNRKIGNNIALGRAIKKLKEENNDQGLERH
jgi:hypothetical protein